ncbi:YbhB/YbcL family Raf kinase inhibitor-like protein [Candidatus Woesearchaeota archaeon]|nr:YbhB/YbcL family Raf kinase inhibitor-like protein [Candidatus Woesearchaeota archaeon]
MKITSPAFEDGKAIPAEYTCKGSDISPELNFEEVPEEAKSLALVMDDPDAPMGTWDHWVVFNIPATATKVAKGTEPEGVAGKNSWDKTGYGGPCPPSGTHRYYFKLYALDAELNLAQGATKAELMKAMQGHIIAEARLMGTFSKD